MTSAARGDAEAQGSRPVMHLPGPSKIVHSGTELRLYS
jgi:hypothetical protein